MKKRYMYHLQRIKDSDQWQKDVKFGLSSHVKVGES